jgi:hypothetical protein
VKGKGSFPRAALLADYRDCWHVGDLSCSHVCMWTLGADSGIPSRESVAGLQNTVSYRFELRGVGHV